MPKRWTRFDTDDDPSDDFLSCTKLLLIAEERGESAVNERMHVDNPEHKMLKKLEICQEALKVIKQDCNYIKMSNQSGRKDTSFNKKMAGLNALSKQNSE